MPAPVYYTGSTIGSATSTPFPGGSGCFLQAVGPVPLASGSALSDGFQLVYGQTKTRSLIDDQSIILFMGRAKPAVEFGQYNFSQFDLTYRVAPDYLPFGSTVETLINAIIAAQQAGSLVMYQDAKGRGTAQHGASYPALYGVLSTPKFTDVTDWPGWTEVTCMFTEVA